MAEQIKQIKKDEVPEHLIEIPDKHWAFWRWAALRGAGFPAQAVLKLSAPDWARVADEALEAERECERARDDAMAEVNGALDELRRSGQWGDKARRGELLDAARALRSGRVPKLKQPAQTFGLIEALKAAFEKRRRMHEAFRDASGDAERELSRAIYEIAQGERFREAVTWQNRHALHTAIDVLLDKGQGGGPRGSKLRQYEELVASYLQRYCVKNDTIGFFGPVGWARLTREGKAFDCKPGSGLVTARKVYFEWWCIDALARTLAEDKRLLPWKVPIRTPFVRLECNAIHHPLHGVVNLPAEFVELLECCDGLKTVEVIARKLTRQAQSIFRDETHLIKALEKLQAQGMIFWDFNISLAPHPEDSLRKYLSRITDEKLRGEYLTRLGELERAREAVAEAAGDSGALDEAMGRLEDTFVRLTGKASTRSAGQMYAGRTLVYEDCRRDAEVTLGPEILQALEPPLSLLLTSARWITFELAKLYKRKFKEIYIGLVRKTGKLSIDGLMFYLEAQRYTSEGETELSDQVLSRFQERWLKMLSIPLNERSVKYRSEELRPFVQSEFNAPRPGWPTACHHCPDVMIAARDCAAIGRGDFQLILGEMHLGGNTLGASLFVYQHPSPEELIRGVEADVPQLKVIPIPPRDSPRQTSRTTYSLISENDFRLEFSRDAFAPDRATALPISSLVVGLSGGELIARTRDGRLTFDLLQVFSGLFNRMSMDSFKIISAQGHTPRITIDRLVICRESWRLPSAEISFAFEKDSASRFLAARRWAREREVPRFVFAKSPIETKPCYVDFDSPIYIDMLSKIVRHSHEAGPDELVIISEMLPTPDMLWLSDAEGNRYTSEFRIVAVDLAR